MNFSAHAHPPLPPLPGVGHDSRVLPPGTLQDSYGGADVRSSSIASLRLKAREHSAAMEFFSTYGHIKWQQDVSGPYNEVLHVPVVFYKHVRNHT